MKPNVISLAAAGVARAAARAAVEAEAARIAALRLPLKEAHKQAAEHAQQRFLVAFHAALEVHTGRAISTVEELEALQPRVTTRPARDPDEPAIVGDCWFLDGYPILYAGPAEVTETDDTVRVERKLLVLPQGTTTAANDG